MSGFFIGFFTAVVTIGLVARFKFRRWRRGGPGRGIDRVLSELDATPEQRTEIKEAFAQLRATGWSMKDEWRAARGDLVEALRDESTDAETVIARREPALRRFETAFREAFERIHAALNANQRMQLATIVEIGPRRRGRRC